MTVVLALFINCTKSKDYYLSKDLKNEVVSFLEKTNLTKGLENQYLVTENDVLNYLKTKPRAVSIRSITPYPSSQVKCYIINYDEGWEIVSGDKRCPLVLAEGENGHFIVDSLSPITVSWLEGVCFDIQSVGSVNYTTLDRETKMKIQETLNLWESISPSSRSEPSLSKDSTNRVVPGIWLETGVTIEYLVDTLIDHQLATKWHQGTPFNNYCPQYAPNNPTRAPAGCVAIAGAQMLYYLHNKMGVPLYAPTSGISSGYVYNQSYSFSSFGNSSSVWDYMSTSQVTTAPYDTSAILIAEVGKKVAMDYQMSSSGAITNRLVSDVFNFYGIDCTYTDYYPEIVNSSLQNGYPIIIRGTPSEYNTGGHAYIIDGYKKTRQVDVYHFRWEPNPNYSGIQPYLPGETREERFYHSPEHYYKMNWGTNLYYTTNMDCYNAWYRVNGDFFDGVNSYNYNRAIIHGFSLLNK